MKRAIYMYVVKENSGYAPCVENWELSLACCKPVIRRCLGNNLRNSHLDEALLLGFCGKSIKNNPNYPLLYALSLNPNNVLSQEEYYSKHSDRSDSIYTLTDGKFIRNSKSECFHNECKYNPEHDLKGVNVFLGGDYSYWDDDGYEFPIDLHFLSEKIKYAPRATHKIEAEELADQIFDWYQNVEKKIVESNKKWCGSCCVQKEDKRKSISGKCK